jgi:hypothetical protein
MQKLSLPHIVLPSEFLTLLKSNVTASNSQSLVSDLFHSNASLEKYLESVFDEFSSGKGISRSIAVLGWHNFRDRLAGVYVHKLLKGKFPAKTEVDLIEDVKDFESRFSGHGIQGISRCFLLGFYLKIANIENKKKGLGVFTEIKIPEEIGAFLRLSQVKSEKIDWLILILLHLLFSLGDKVLLNALMSGKKIDELLLQMSHDSRKIMFENLLSYSVSINDPEIFLYDKI